MPNLKFFVFFILVFLLNSCSKELTKENLIKEKSLELQVIEAYREGLEALEGRDVLFAAKKFNEAEILFPQGEWAPKSALMAAYSYYTQDYYGDAISELERFITVYPLHENLQYAYYLLAICYYEQIMQSPGCFLKSLSGYCNISEHLSIPMKSTKGDEKTFDDYQKETAKYDPLSELGETLYLKILGKLNKETLQKTPYMPS